jgi:predicted HAD superfamily Cof-like phosphohydrolase
MVVYIRSESTKFGINLEKTLDIIMQSNMSKLGADGKPIYDERGKVMKGPNYWKPESKIAEMLENQLKE